MSVSEQELFGLMALAQEQQKAATLILRRLEAQQAELTQTIAKARSAVEEMNKAGHSSALIIEKSTRIAVEKGVQSALEGIQQQTRSALGDSVSPAVKALQGVTERAEQAEENLHQASRSLSWKWTAICAAMGCTLLATVVGLSMLLVPTPGEIAELRANVEYLEAKGGKINLTHCGPSKRLCAEIDIKADAWGENGQFRIIKGY